MARRRQRRFYQQAQLDALVRFGPELAGLIELQQQAQSNLKGSVRSARGNARNIIAETRRAEPQLQEVYGDALEAQGTYAPVVAQNAASLPPELQAAIAAEREAATRRVGESRGDALADLQQRRVSAREGQQFAVQNARRTFADEIGQVLRRRQSLGREIGAFTASTAGELRENAAQRRLQRQITLLSQRGQERRSLRSAGFDPDTGRPIPGGPLDRDADNRPGTQKKGGGSEGMTQTEINRRERRVEKWREETQKIETASTLWERYGGTPMLEPDGTKRPPTPAEIELRMLEEGYSKREIDIARDLLRNRGRLSSRGVRAMRELGLKVPKRWRPRPANTGVSLTPGPSGQVRPN